MQIRREQLVLFFSITFALLGVIAELEPFLYSKRKKPRYEPCGELTPSFSYDLAQFTFANNTIHDIKYKYEEEFEAMPTRCQDRLMTEISDIELYRTRSRCSLLKLPRNCPKIPSRIKRKKVSRSELVVAFIFIMGSYSDISIATAERMLADIKLDWQPRFVFHVDESSTKEMWANVTSWVDKHPSVSVVVPRGTAVDVEWGDIPIVTAYITSMREAIKTWPDVTTLVSLSESHVLVVTPSELGDFFHKYAGLSFPGMPPGQVPGNDTLWRLWLNDAVFPCGRKMYHIGWKTDPISAEDGYYHVADAYAFWSRDFVDWVLFSEEGDYAVRSLYERMRYATTTDELFWGTLFYQSPFCHTVAKLDKIEAAIVEFSSVTWNRECDSVDNTGKDLCMSMSMQPMSWWYGTSAEYITPGDVPLLLTRRPMFARKLRPDKLFHETLSLLHTDENVLLPSAPLSEATTSESPSYHKSYYIAVDIRRGIGPKKCVKIISSNGLTKWIPCPPAGAATGLRDNGVCGNGDDCEGSEYNVNSDGRVESDLTPTPFQLRNCIGHIKFRSDDGYLGASVGVGDEDVTGSSIHIIPNNKSLTAAVQSSVLPSGYMYGHCSVRAVGNVKAHSGIFFCLSQILLRLMSRDPWSYQDIAYHAEVNSTIGFLPCDPRGTVGAAQQLFVFQHDGSIVVATRHTKDIRSKAHAKIALCLVLINDIIKLRRCSSAKPSQRLTLFETS